MTSITEISISNYMTHDYLQAGIILVVATLDIFYRRTIYEKTDSVALDLTAFSFITVTFGAVDALSSKNFDEFFPYGVKLIAIIFLAFIGLILHTNLRERTKEEIERYFEDVLRKKVSTEEQQDLLIQLRRLTEAVLEVDVGYHSFSIWRWQLQGNRKKEKKRTLILESLKALGIEHNDFIIDPEALLINHRGRYLIAYIAIGLLSLIVVAV